MSAVSIRPATLADIPAIARIYAHAVNTGTASFELEAPTEAEMTRRMTALLDSGPVSYTHLTLPTNREV